LPALLAVVARTRPDVVVPGEHSHLARESAKEIQACDEVCESLANVAGEHGEVRLIRGNALYERAHSRLGRQA
jgi:hypothetical protein